MTRAARVIAFIERHILVPDGASVGHPLVLDDFQKEFIRAIYDNPAGMDTAAAACADYLNVTTVALPAPAPVKSAGLLLVGSLYEQREAQGERQFYKNPAFEALLNPYRVHA